MQAARWTELPDGLGYIYSFNGPHSLFADTIRSLRVLALAHQLGSCAAWARGTARSPCSIVCCGMPKPPRASTSTSGEGRDHYDVRGRVAHESIFNLNDGSYRCPSTQQGYSPFTTWTRGLAWILCGYAEQLEFLESRPEEEFAPPGKKARLLARFLGVARATADYYLAQTPTDGVPYWDTGAPGLAQLGNYLDRPADPFNDYEPVDSSAAAIAAQGLIRLGRYLAARRQAAAGDRYLAAGLTIARTIFREPYLSTSPRHQGLLLHTVYHRPNGWDYVPPGRKDSLRRIRAVGRLSCAGTGAPPPAAGGTGVRLDVLWGLNQPPSCPIRCATSPVCVFTRQTTRSWAVGEAVRRYAAAGVRGVTVWREALAGTMAPPPAG